MRALAKDMYLDEPTLVIYDRTSTEHTVNKGHAGRLDGNPGHGL